MPDNWPAEGTRRPAHIKAPLAGRARLGVLVLWALWLLYLLVFGLGAIRNGLGLFSAPVPDGPGGPGDAFLPPGAMLGGGAQDGIVAIDLWACASALFFGLVIVRNRFGWSHGKLLAWGGLAFASMLGRFTTGVFLAWLFALIHVPFALAFLVAPFGLLFGGLSLIFTLGIAAGALFSLVVGVPVLVFNQVFAFEHALAVYRYQTGGLGGYIVRFMLWLRNERMPDAPPDDSKGARFATPQEVVRLHAGNSPQAMAFGHLGSPLFLHTDKHVLIMASTRSGKGVTLIIPHLLRYAGSAFVLDPKEENARAIGRQRSVLNKHVHYLDPFGISGKEQSRFNPLSRFTPDNMEAESKSLAAALFVLGERDHWSAAGQQLLVAIILYVYVSVDIELDKKTCLWSVRFCSAA